jgi:hypothetical protein
MLGEGYKVKGEGLSYDRLWMKEVGFFIIIK